MCESTSNVPLILNILIIFHTFHFSRYVSPDNGNKVFWYSFDYGLVHILMYSSEHDFTIGSRQVRISRVKAISK